MTKEPPHLPPVYFDVLSIEEENGGRNKSDVKVLDIHWHTVHINTVDGCHLGQLLCRLGQLVGQCKVKRCFFLFVFVLSMLHYWNSPLSGSPQYSLGKLQRVQNSVAMLVMKSRKCDHVQPLFPNLHSLPLCSRTDYTFSTLCFYTFTDSSPICVALLLSVYIYFRHLCWSFHQT